MQWAVTVNSCCGLNSLASFRLLQLRSIFRLITKLDGKVYLSLYEGQAETLLKKMERDDAEFLTLKKSIRGISGVIASDRAKFDGISVRTVSIPISEIGAEVEMIIRSLPKTDAGSTEQFSEMLVLDAIVLFLKQIKGTLSRPLRPPKLTSHRISPIPLEGVDRTRWM